MQDPVIRNTSFNLVHVPDLVRYGSKPGREIARNPGLESQLTGALRPFSDAVRYPPNQTFIGNLSPDALGALPRPWFVEPPCAHAAAGPFGEIVSQEHFYALLHAANVLEPALVELTEETLARASEAVRPLLVPGAGGSVHRRPPPTREHIEQAVRAGEALALHTGPDLVGCVRPDTRAEGRGDPNLSAQILLEALCTKASGALALANLLHREGLDPAAIDYVISCGEEACGDRYQRGAGGMAKAIGEMCGCINASGMDIKNFCAGPASALVAAGALVKAGLYDRVAVVAGGSAAKLGMKFEAFLREDIPVLDDCLGAIAFLVTADDGVSPKIRLERGAVGTASIGASTSDEAVYRELILQPLEALGMSWEDIDRFAPELHNPEIMEHAGSGDVAHKNYRMIAALAVRDGAIRRDEMEAFVAGIGMVGFAPTQGHIPSGVPYLGHALEAMRAMQLTRVMFVCKASVFLNRMTQLFDGVSFILEAPTGASNR